MNMLPLDICRRNCKPQCRWRFRSRCTSTQLNFSKKTQKSKLSLITSFFWKLFLLQVLLTSGIKLIDHTKQGFKKIKLDVHKLFKDHDFFLVTHLEKLLKGFA